MGKHPRMKVWWDANPEQKQFNGALSCALNNNVVAKAISTFQAAKMRERAKDNRGAMIQKMSDAKRVNWANPEYRKAQIAAQTRGKLASEKFKKKNIGMKYTPERLAHFREIQLPKLVAGWKKSEKWRVAITKANHSPEHSANSKLNWIKNGDKILAGLAKAIRTNTKIEILLQEALVAVGQPFMTQIPIMGHTIADIRLADSKILIFADGCYWHRCPIHFPQNGKKKREADEKITNTLRLYGWEVFRFWEHEIKADANGCITKVLEGRPIRSPADSSVYITNLPRGLQSD
jgi:DNA mismatch endonuclease (patch repair protein)